MQIQAVQKGKHDKVLKLIEEKRRDPNKGDMVVNMKHTVNHVVTYKAKYIISAV